MPHINSKSGTKDLQCWIDYWSAKYPIASDIAINNIAATHFGSLSLNDLIVIFNWKLEARFQEKAIKQITGYDAINPGDIQRRTGQALAAETDFQAVELLRGLPQMATLPSIAVASSILMVLDQSRWTVMDRMANTSLMALKTALSPLETSAGALRGLYCALHNFNPQAPEFWARDLDWGVYLQVCREIVRLTSRELRTIDRALFESRGNLYFECDKDSGNKPDSSQSALPPARPIAPAPGVSAGVEIINKTKSCLCSECFLQGLRNWILAVRGHVKQSTRTTNYSDGKSFSDAFDRGYVKGTRGRQNVERHDCLSIDLFPAFWAARTATGASNENAYKLPIEGAFSFAPPCQHCEGRCNY